MMSAINIALTGLESATRRLNASAANIANLQTAGSLEAGGQAPYTPVTTAQTAITDGNGNSFGVMTQTVPKTNPFVPLYSPDSPFANSEGIIGMPNTDLAEEAVNMMIAKATYKANLMTIKVSEDMTDELLRAIDKKV
jgi:flagellar basal-body rod protein FlgC